MTSKTKTLSKELIMKRVGSLVKLKKVGIHYFGKCQWCNDLGTPSRICAGGLATLCPCLANFIIMNKIEKFCRQFGITEDQFFGREKISGSLYLRSVTALVPGFNPTVGGSLDLQNNKKYIGKKINMPVINIPEIKKPSKNFIWEKYGKKFALIDGIFCEILNQVMHRIEGKELHVYSAKKINKDGYFFIVQKDNFFAHAIDLKKAVEDLEFKIISEILKKEPINKDTIVTINHYRLITGACEMGCNSWMEDNGLTENKTRADELLPLLKKSNAYGYEKFKRLITF